MLYFAYGSNLNKRQMTGRCPDATPICSLLLPKAKLVFRTHADVEYSENETDIVPGGLWNISRACERALDSYEGVAGGYYEKQYMEVELKRGKKTTKEDCLIYTMIDRGGDRHGRDYYRPGRDYFNVCLQGYADFDLDTAPLFAALAPFVDKPIKIGV